MIAFVEGELAHKEPTYAIVAAHGVGYALHISLATHETLPAAGQPCRLLTHLHVREDAQLLYGFATPAEKQLFLHLISVSGIGPNTALVILSSLPAEELRRAILQEDVRALQAVKGIGAKTAQRAILELKDKIGKEIGTSGASLVAGNEGNTRREEALTALITLGFAKPAAEKSLAQVVRRYGPDLSVEELIKYVLKTA